MLNFCNISYNKSTFIVDFIISFLAWWGCHWSLIVSFGAKPFNAVLRSQRILCRFRCCFKMTILVVWHCRHSPRPNIQIVIVLVPFSIQFLLYNLSLIDLVIFNDTMTATKRRRKCSRRSLPISLSLSFDRPRSSYKRKKQPPGLYFFVTFVLQDDWFTRMTAWKTTSTKRMNLVLTISSITSLHLLALAALWHLPLMFLGCWHTVLCALWSSMSRPKCCLCSRIANLHRPH